MNIFIILEKNCSAVAQPDDGNATSSDPTYTVGSVVTFSCNEGFNLTIQQNTTCTVDATWNPPPPLPNSYEFMDICKGMYVFSNGRCHKNIRDILLSSISFMLLYI